MSEPALKVGDRAPDFKLASTEGKDLGLTDFRGKKVVLYFYPKDDTPGCTAEACGFRDNLDEFKDVNAVILGVSRDSIDSHDRFRGKYMLPFTLLSDVDAEVCKKYGVYKQKDMYGKTTWGVERTTFVIDEQGKISKIYPKVKVDGHIPEVLEFLKSA